MTPKEAEECLRIGLVPIAAQKDAYKAVCAARAAMIEESGEDASRRIPDELRARAEHLLVNCGVELSTKGAAYRRLCVEALTTFFNEC